MAAAPGQGAAGPLMAPGAAGAPPTEIVRVAAAEVPQAFVAVTATVPPVVPTVVLIEAVVEVPTQPVGKVQVYEVAPGTGVTL